ncbi:MAG: hypothetical protein ACRD0G_08135, partial [Acidimicrobiales bacterium]
PNLLAELVARAVPAYLANAALRLVALRSPYPLAFGVRAGRSAATARWRDGAVEVSNGIAPDAVMVLEGDAEPLVEMATESMLRELRHLRLRRP